jgi:hypothetical protein
MFNIGNFININDTINGGNPVKKKRAIINLAMFDDSYILGACCSAYNTRKYLKSNIDLVIMVDNNFYHRFYPLLSKYYDYIHNLGDLWYYPISIKQTYVQEKYSKWVSYSPNKWRCLELTQYDKILFMDIDMLVEDSKFFDVFELDSMAFYKTIAGKLEETAEFNPEKYYKLKKPVDYHKFLENCKVDNINTMYDGSLVLLTPSQKLHNEYKEFLDTSFPDGIEWIKWNLFDEVSIIYFMVVLNKLRYSVIPPEYAGSHKNIGLKLLCNNFRSSIKPWKRPTEFKWDEEKKWDTLLKEIECPTLLYIQKLDYHKFYEYFRSSEIQKQLKNPRNLPFEYKVGFNVPNKKTMLILLPNNSRGLRMDAEIIKSILEPIYEIKISENPEGEFGVCIFIENINKLVSKTAKLFYFPNLEFISDWDLKFMQDNPITVCCKNQLTYDTLKNYKIKDLVLTKFTTIDLYQLDNRFNRLKLFGDREYYISLCGNHGMKNYTAILEAWKLYIEKFKENKWLIMVRKQSKFNTSENGVFKSLFENNKTIHSLSFMNIPSVCFNEGLLNTEHRIILIDELTELDKYSLMYSSLGLVLPSQIEGFGITLNEALMLDKPIITSDLLPMKEFGNKLVKCSINSKKVGKYSELKVDTAVLDLEDFSEKIVGNMVCENRKKYLENYQYFRETVVNLI